MLSLSDLRERLEAISPLRAAVHGVRKLLWYRYVLRSVVHPITMQRFCFFYLPQVPDFGSEFVYLKLGKKEAIANPCGHTVVFEADLPENLSCLNEYLMDYSGLYALYKNGLVTADRVLVIHYDTQILHQAWDRVVQGAACRSTVVFSTWAIDKERAEVCEWVYRRIDDVFLEVHGRTFLSYLMEDRISVLPNSSQFACSRGSFCSLMDFLLPIYRYIQGQHDLTYHYAHLLERAWGLYFALHGYRKISVVRDSHTQCHTGRYNPNAIDFPILTAAIAGNARKFSDILPPRHPKPTLNA